MVGSLGLGIDPLQELFQRGHQQGGLALPEQVHERHLLLQGEVQQTQTVQHSRLQLLLACRGREVEKRDIRTRGLSDASKHAHARTHARTRALTGEDRVGVQLADALLQQAEAERQRG